MNFHVVGLPHLQTHSSVSHCAYSQKVRRFADMMHDRGHTVYLYTSEDNDARCTEHISCISKAVQTKLFKPPLDWNPHSNPLWAAMAKNVIREVKKRCQPGDFLCLISGSQEPIAAGLADQDLTVVEFGVGYSGVFAPHVVYESYAWMHSVYGSYAGQHVMSYEGKNFDAVIPNSYDPAEFPMGNGNGGYLLYMGRLIYMKGINIVSAIQRETGLPLVVAGEGDFRPDVPHEYVGVVGPEKRAELMGGAVATLYPTMYLEPFGGVAIETMFTGTPSITSDWGAFPENIQPKYRCRTLQQYVDAVEMAKGEDRTKMREYAIDRFSTKVVGDKYERYFEQLATLKDMSVPKDQRGWYMLRRYKELATV